MSAFTSDGKIISELFTVGGEKASIEMMGRQEDKGAKGPHLTPESLIFLVLMGKIHEKAQRWAVGYSNCFCTWAEERTSRQGWRFQTHKVVYAPDIFLAVDFRSGSTR